MQYSQSLHKLLALFFQSEIHPQIRIDEQPNIRDLLMLEDEGLAYDIGERYLEAVEGFV